MSRNQDQSRKEVNVSSEPSNCPFCGIHVVETGRGYAVHHRAGCFMGAKGSTYFLPHELTAWNTRVPTKAQPVELGEVWSKHQDINGIKMARECFKQILNDCRDKSNPDNIEQLVECGLAALTPPVTQAAPVVAHIEGRKA